MPGHHRAQARLHHHQVRTRAHRHRTVVMVLHDLNQACRYADYVIAMKNGRIYSEGAPAEVITADSVEEVFGLRCQVVVDPASGTPLAVPIGRHHATTDAEPAGVER